MSDVRDLIGAALEGRAGDLTAEDRGRVLAAVSSITAALAAVPPSNGGPSPPPVSASERDGGLLTLQEAAALAGLAPEAFRRRALFRPAIVKIGRRTLRVSESKLRRILARRVEAV